MAKKKNKTTSNTQKDIERERRRQNKLDSIKNGFETNKTKSFDQIFAIMTESRLAKELGIGFTTFRNKIKSPGDFTMNELRRLSDLFQIDFDMVINFIKDLMKQNKKGDRL